MTTIQVPDHTVYQNTDNQGHDPSQQTVPQGTVFQNVNKQGQVLATETMRAMPQTWTRPSDREEEQVSAGTVYQNYVPPPPPVPPRRSEDPPPIPVKSYRAPKGAPPIPDKSYREAKKPPFTKNPPIETKMDSINQGSDFVQSEANVGVTASKSEQDSQSGAEGGDTWSLPMPSCEGQSHPPAGDGTPTEVKKGSIYGNPYYSQESVGLEESTHMDQGHQSGGQGQGHGPGQAYPTPYPGQGYDSMPKPHIPAPYPDGNTMPTPHIPQRENMEKSRHESETSDTSMRSSGSFDSASGENPELTPSGSYPSMPYGYPQYPQHQYGYPMGYPQHGTPMYPWGNPPPEVYHNPAAFQQWYSYNMRMYQQYQYAYPPHGAPPPPRPPPPEPQQPPGRPPPPPPHQSPLEPQKPLPGQPLLQPKVDTGRSSSPKPPAEGRHKGQLLLWQL